MPRIVGVDVPNDKRIVIGMTYVFGVGLFDNSIDANGFLFGQLAHLT